MADYTAEINELSNHFGSVNLDKEPAIELNGLTRILTIPGTFNRTIAIVGDINSNIVVFRCDRFIDGHDISKCENKKIWWLHDALMSAQEDDLMVNLVDAEKVYFSWQLRPEVTAQSGKISVLLRFSDFDGETVKWAWQSYSVSGLAVDGKPFAIASDTPAPLNLRWGDAICEDFDLTQKDETSYIPIEPGYIYVTNNVSLSSVGFCYSADFETAYEAGNYAYKIFNVFQGLDKLGDTSGTSGSDWPSGKERRFKDGAIFICPSTETLEKSLTYKVTVNLKGSDGDFGEYSGGHTIQWYTNPNFLGDNGEPIKFVPYNADAARVTRIKLKPGDGGLL